MESESKTSAPSFTWPLPPSKPRARTPITAKPPLAPLPRVLRASIPPPMIAEPMPAKPVAAKPVAAKPVRVEAAPVRVEPVRVEVPSWIEPVRVAPAPVPATVPVRVEPAPVPVEPMRVEPVYLEPEPATLEDDPIADFTSLDSMSTFGAGILQARRGPNKFFLFAVLLAVAAVAALLLR